MTGRDTIRRLVTGDDRGVSEVIGAILVFGLVVALMAVLQVQAIPSANEEVEVEHNQRIQGDLSGLQASLSRTATTGSGESVRVELGTSYPPRMLFYNPAPVQGRFTTTESGVVKVTSVVATNSETSDYIDGSLGGVGSGIETRSVVYTANYNEFSNAPDVVSEHSVLISDYDDGNTVVEDPGELVSGRDVALTTMAGDVERSSSGVVSVRTKAVSGPSQTVPVQREAADDNIEISVPTRISEEVWIHQILASEIDDTGDGNLGPEPGDVCDDIAGVDTSNERYVVDCSYGENPGAPNVLTLVLQEEDGSGNAVVYNMEMAKVGIGDSFDSPEAHYITAVPTPSASVPMDETVTLTAQVRDKYNNPVSGVPVTASVPSGSAGSASVVGSGVSNEDGKVFVQYTSSTAGTHDVDVSFGGGSAIETATFNVEVGADDENGPTVSIARLETDSTGTCDTFTNTGLDCATTRTIEQYTVEFDASDNVGNEAGIAYVEIAIEDSGNNVITKETIHGGGRSVVSEVWMSPWLTPAMDDPDHVRVTVVDKAGKTGTDTRSI
jgi:hypothetical protein